MKRSDIRLVADNAYLIIDRDIQQDQPEKHEHYTIQNISRGGVRFCSNEHFDIDERVKLELYIDEKLSHSAHGRICYHDEDRHHRNYYGISFIDKFIHF